jgi:hypothetical protein
VHVCQPKNAQMPSRSLEKARPLGTYSYINARMAFDQDDAVSSYWATMRPGESAGIVLETEREQLTIRQAARLAPFLVPLAFQTEAWQQARCSVAKSIDSQMEEPTLPEGVVALSHSQAIVAHESLRMALASPRKTLRRLGVNRKNMQRVYRDLHAMKRPAPQTRDAASGQQTSVRSQPGLPDLPDRYDGYNRHRSEGWNS